MKKVLKTLFVLLLFPFALLGQTKGIVVDENNNPIPFVNIWIENGDNGTTSEQNGTFVIDVTPEKKLIFSVLGYQKKSCKATEVQKVVLQEATFQLNEVVIVKTKNTKQLEIGNNKDSFYQAFENGPRIDLKFFPYLTTYSKTKYIKFITLNADTRIENTTIKLHLFSVGTNGYPDQELNKKDILTTLSKGVNKSKIDITDLHIKMPQNGIFVSFEKLMIANNKIEKINTDSDKNKSKGQTTFSPFVLYNYVEKDFSFLFKGGKWIKQQDETFQNTKTKIMIYEPAINLILTN